MKIVDMHLDLPDIYKSFSISKKDFFGNKKNNPIDYNKLLESEIDIMGISLYFDHEFLQTDYYDGVTSYYDFCMEMFSAFLVFYLYLRFL